MAAITQGQDILVQLLQRKACPTEEEGLCLATAMHAVDRYFRTVPKKALLEAIAYVNRCIAQGKGEVVGVRPLAGDNPEQGKHAETK